MLWSGKVEILVVSGNYTMFYSGRVKAENVFAVVLRNNNAKSLTKVEYYSDRVILVKISANPVDIVLV